MNGTTLAIRPACRAFTPAPFLAAAPRTTTRSFSVLPHLQAQKINKEKAAKEKAKKKRRKHPGYKQYDLKEMEQFTLCDAMR